jgi:KDO2-lipid IV(A) lauroyltransferase
MAIDNTVAGLQVPERQARDIVKASVVRFGPMFLEVLRMPKLSRSFVAEHVTIEGKQHLEAALAYGRGAVLATAHSGNWELMGGVLAICGFPLVAVVQKQTNGEMDRFINEYREATGMHVTYKTGVREMIKLLGEGRIIGLLMDQNADKDGVFVDFLGRKACTPIGAAALARMKAAPVVPAFIASGEGGKHTVTLHPPVWVNKTADKDRDILVTTQQLTAIIENHVRRHPSEWFWLHNRWKNRPHEEGEA